MPDNARPYFHETFSYLLTEEEWDSWKFESEPQEDSPSCLELLIKEADLTS